MSTTGAATRPEVLEHGTAQKTHKSKKRKHPDEVAQPDESDSKKKKKRTTVAEHDVPKGPKLVGPALEGAERTDSFTQPKSQDSSVQVSTTKIVKSGKKQKKHKPTLEEEEQEDVLQAREVVKNKTPSKASPAPQVVARQSSSPHPRPEQSAKKKNKKRKDGPTGGHLGETNRKPSQHKHSLPERGGLMRPAEASTSQPEKLQPKKKRKRQSTPDEEEDEAAEPKKFAKRHKEKKELLSSPISPAPVAPPSPAVEVSATAEEAPESSTESTAGQDAQTLPNGGDATSSATTTASDSSPPALAPPGEGAEAEVEDQDPDGLDAELQDEDTVMIDDDAPSPFHSTRMSIYVPIPARSLDPSTALSSLSAEHLAPTLLTYYPPARGVVLAFCDCALSSERPEGKSREQRVVMAMCGDQYGVSYIWLTATLLVFMPDRGMELSGWMNVCSEGFVGLVSYNYFQVGIAKERIPRDWTWRPAGGVMTMTKKKGRKARMSKDGSVDTTQETGQETAVEGSEDDGAGYFVDASGNRVSGTLAYRVVDCDVVPGATRETWTLQVEGTLLDAEDEAKAAEEEQEKEMRLRNKSRGKAMMSGALPDGARGSQVATK